MTTLFDYAELNNLKLKNHIFRSATWEGLAHPDGTLPEEVYQIYEELSEGGIGAIVTGLTDVSPYNWALVGNMRLCSDALIPEYRRLTNIVRKNDCRILTQLNMDEYIRAEKRLIKVDIDDLTHEDIKDIVRQFTEAAQRAEKAEFDGVQIHLAYGWLLNRFINPHYNHRSDEYGGSVENRLRIVLEILKSIKEAIPKLHVSTKFSFYKNEDGEVAINDCVKICEVLSNKGIDSIEILGEHSPEENNPKYESCYLSLALAVKPKIDTPIILTGGNHDLLNMNRIIKDTGIEYFGICRPLIREPNLPNRWLNGDNAKSTCISCSKCYHTNGKRCIFKID